jgi:putative ATP-dependent endonuclease of the OLD family
VRIESVRIQNLRSFDDEIVSLDNYNTLVGANGAGKSTVLCALNIFFRETDHSATSLTSLEKEDFHCGNVDNPITVTVTFVDLSEEAQTDFANYYRHNKLIVSAVATYDAVSATAQVKQQGHRLGMTAFSEFFKALGDRVSVPDLRIIYAELRGQYELPNATTKDQMTSALRKYEADRPDDCVLIPSEDEFYGVSQGKGLLRNHVQWVYVPAVKDASSEQAEGKNTALGKLLARTVRSQVNFSEKLAALRKDAETAYQAMLAAEQGALDKISGDLQERLTEWSVPEATAKIEWHQDPKSSVKIEEPMARMFAGDGAFTGAISRFGHGLQRSYIIALLQGLALGNDDNQNPKLLLGIEEPELYQHPPQARHLATVLQKLSMKNSQVIVSTHSPYFVDGSGFDRVRLVRKQRADGKAVVRSCTIAHVGDEWARVTGEADIPLQGTMVKLNQVMQPHLAEMFFSPKLVLVEGLEDAAYINAWLMLTGSWDAFRSTGAHVLAVNGKSELIRPLIIATKMGIPSFVIFDCDGDKISHTNPDTAASRRRLHERDNKAVLHLVGGNADEPFPVQNVIAERYAVWPHDLGASIKADAGAEYDAAFGAASQLYGGVGNLQKNTLHICAVLNELKTAQVGLPTLDQLCEAIINFANAD